MTRSVAGHVVGLAGRRAAFIAAVMAAYASLYLIFGGLRFEPMRDEVTFWPVALHFSQGVWPQIRDYPALNTPLPFVVFGWLAGGGIWAGRALNLVLSFVIVCVIGLPRHARDLRSPLAAAALLAFPYYVGVSVMLYTDIIASFFVLLGIVLYRIDRHILSGAAFVLAISSRQYMVAFPVGLMLFEALNERRLAPIAPQALACASLLGWIWMFGGFGPSLGIARWNPATTQLWNVRPHQALYFLTCIGLYFVFPEAVLSKGWHGRPRNRTLWIMGSLAVLFLTFPPLRNVQGLATMGYLDRAAGAVLPDALRMLLFYGLALLACLRFAERTLPAILVAANAALMMKAYVAWDKYALPLLVVLWYLHARGRSEAPGVWEVTRSGEAREARSPS